MRVYEHVKCVCARLPQLPGVHARVTAACSLAALPASMLDMIEFLLIELMHRSFSAGCHPGRPPWNKLEETLGLVLLLYQFHLTVATDTATCGPKSLHRNARIVLMTVREIAITLAIDSAGFGSRHAAPSLSGLQLSTAPARTAAAPAWFTVG